MKKFFKSFRFEIISCSLLSLLCTLLTEVTIIAVCYIAYHLLNKKSMAVPEGTTFMEQFATTFEQMFGSGMGTSTQEAIGIAIILVISAIAFFTLYFIVMTNRLTDYIEVITKGVNAIAGGDFEKKIDLKFENELTDIASNLNQMSEDLKNLREAEKETENKKNLLITNVAHDLRTPLTSIIGYLDLALDEKITEETRGKYIGVAYRKSKKMEQLIDDLFTYTKLDFGEVKLNKTRMDFIKLLEQMLEEFYPNLQEKGMVLNFEKNCELALIDGDGHMIVRAFSNLVGNALKYGADGKRLDVIIQKTAKTVVAEVKNYGELIPEKDLDNIFQKFYRVESSRSSATGGTGLGLPIAKDIIVMHGGTINVKSNLTDGTVFTVTLPLLPEDQNTVRG